MGPSAREKLGLLPAWIGAGLVLGLLLFTVAGRIGHPFDLEWMEGGMLLHGARVARGLPIYVAPGPEFIPYIYPPLYPWALGLLGKLGLLDYPSARLLSLIGALGAAGALVALVRQEGGRTTWGVAAAALFLSTYEDSGTFFDLVRIDGPMMALLGWSLVCVRGGRLRLGGLLLVLAFLTKHNAAAFGLPAALWLWRARGLRPALRFTAWSAGPALAAVGLLQWRSEGRFLRYLLEVPAEHGFVLERFFPLAPTELALALPLSSALALGVALLRARRADAGALYWAAQGALAVLLCMVMRGHQGGYLNVLVPGHWALAAAGGLGMAAVDRALGRAWVRPALGALLLAQLWVGRWSPADWTPTAADRAAGEALLARIRQIEGPILSPHAPYLPVQAGKEPSFALIALWDVDHEGGPFHADVAFLAEGIAAGRWSAILLANERLGHGLLDHYRLGERLRFQGRAFYPVTGWKVRPGLLYVPGQEPRAGGARSPVRRGGGAGAAQAPVSPPPDPVSPPPVSPPPVSPPPVSPPGP
jgi:hypothetical protein